MSGLVEQPHGGALRPPGVPGYGLGHGPAAKRTSMRRVSNDVLAILAENSVPLTLKLMEAARGTDDLRVLAVVTDRVLAYVLGSPGDRPKSLDEATHGLDTSHLTAEETAEALHCCERLAHFLAIVEQRKRGVVVEAEAVG